MYLELAKQLLAEEYHKYYDKADEFGKTFMDEKIRHSYQVLGVGLYILRHEILFQSCSAEENDRLKATVLLHDIGRFYEAYIGQYAKKVDHGVYGAEILANEALFSRNDVILPVRHHGHLIEKLYEDEIYCALDADERKYIDEVIYLVRDADKLANFYLLSRNFVKMEKLFFPLSLQADNDFVPSEQVRNAFMAHQAINKQDVRNCADQALMILACLFDVRYVSSFVLMSRWGVMDKLLAKMTKFWQAENAELFAGVIRDYLQEKQLQQI